MTTLADLTPEELNEAEGLWCEDEDGNLCIYREDPRVPNWLAVCVYPDRVDNIASARSRITLCYDLPRAWSSDGTPPAGKWQHATQTEAITPGSIWDLTTKKTPTHRRFVGGWEEE